MSQFDGSTVRYGCPRERLIRAWGAADAHEKLVLSRWLDRRCALGGCALGRRSGGRGHVESQAPTGPHDPHVAVRELDDIDEGRRGKRLRTEGQLHLARR